MPLDLREQLQTALSGAYTLERELGGGGMSRVFVAQDAKLGRRVVVKVLHPDLAAGVSVERFEREILLAAGLQHPCIVPVLSAGDVEGLPYYTMPFVDGPSLRSRIGAAEALPLGETLKILRDVASALSYAHAQGVVHRDIKPENVLLSGGYALVADFGIAKALTAAQTGGPAGALTGAGIVIGTAAYMAPEQAVGSTDVDHRADIYAFGCMAYELLVGRTPFAGREVPRILAAQIVEAPRPITEIRSDLPTALSALVMQCLEKEPEHRPANAAQMVPALEAPGLPGAGPPRARQAPAAAGGGRARSPARFAWIAGVAAAAIALAFVAVRAIRGGAAPDKGRDPILVADFRSPPNDTVLGAMITEAFRTDLSQSQVVQLVPAARIAATLREMQRPANSRVDATLAREIAQREGVKAVVDGDVSLLGKTYLLSVRLLSADSGQTLAAFRETAQGADSVIPAVDRLSAQLRGRIGETLHQVENSRPLEQVTTSSLEALRKYTLALHALDVEGDYAKGQSLLREAIALDTGFAMAYRKLGTAIRESNGPAGQQMDALVKAYSHRDRLPDVERYLTVASYYQMGPEPDPAKALAAYESVIKIQPGNALALNNAANVYADLGNDQQALAYTRRAIEADSQYALAYRNLANRLYTMGRRDEALHVLDRFAANVPGNFTAEFVRIQILIADVMYDSAAAHLRASQRKRPTDLEFQSYAESELEQMDEARGRLGAAAVHLAAVENIDKRRDWPGASLNRGLWLAFDDVWYAGRRAAALERLNAVLARYPLASLSAEDRPYVQVATTYALAGRPDRAREILAAQAKALSPGALEAAEVGRHGAFGEIALAENKPDIALAEFRASAPSWCAMCAWPGIARAHDAAGRSDSAIANYERFLATPGLSHADTDPVHLARILHRLGELYDAKGDTARAASMYRRFASMWAQADSSLQPIVASTNRRLAQLAPSEH